MDPINIIIGLNIIASFGANASGAKKSFKSKVGAVREKPKTFLQWLPVSLSTLTLLLLIVSLFEIGTLEYTSDYQIIRYVGLIVYLIFTWIQIWAVKTLGENYSQEVVVLKNHSIVKSVPFKFIRHPQYFSQILLDFGAAFATLSFIVLPFAILLTPFLIMRAVLEEKLFTKHFGDEWKAYKKESGFMLPFIG